MRVFRIKPRGVGKASKPPGPAPAVPAQSLVRLSEGVGELDELYDVREAPEPPPEDIHAVIVGDTQVQVYERGPVEHFGRWGWAWRYLPMTLAVSGQVHIIGKLVAKGPACPRCGSTGERVLLTWGKKTWSCSGCDLTVGNTSKRAPAAWDPKTSEAWRLTDEGGLGERITNGTTEEAEPMAARRRTTPIPGDDAEAKPAAPRPQKPRTFTRKLDVALTAEERDERQESLLTALRDGEELAAEKSAAMADFRQRSKALATRVVELRHAATDRIEKRDVQCEERFIDRTGEVQVVRLDTGKVIDRRPQTAEERQQVIPGTEPDETEVREPKLVRVVRRKKAQAEAPVEG